MAQDLVTPWAVPQLVAVCWRPWRTFGMSISIFAGSSCLGKSTELIVKKSDIIPCDLICLFVISKTKKEQFIPDVPAEKWTALFEYLSNFTYRVSNIQYHANFALNHLTGDQKRFSHLASIGELYLHLHFWNTTMLNIIVPWKIYCISQIGSCWRNSGAL